MYFYLCVDYNGDPDTYIISDVELSNETLVDRMGFGCELDHIDGGDLILFDGPYFNRKIKKNKVIFGDLGVFQ